MSFLANILESQPAMSFPYDYAAQYPANVGHDLQDMLNEQDIPFLSDYASEDGKLNSITTILFENAEQVFAYLQFEEEQAIQAVDVKKFRKRYIGARPVDKVAMQFNVKAFYADVVARISKNLPVEVETSGNSVTVEA